MMKFLVIVALAICVSAQADPRICCRAPNASTGCTANIPTSLCQKAGGTIITTGTTAATTAAAPTVAPSPTDRCCCFGRDATGADKCLPNVLVSTCLGVSVQGRCQPAEVPKCCCQAAGTTSSLDCIPRIPVALCEKSGASCVAAPTPAPVCTCTFNKGTVNEVTQQLDSSVCTKFQGEVNCASAPTRCCCIPRVPGQPAPNPMDMTAFCIPNTLISDCVTRKRSGVCRGAVAPTPAPAPRCRCQDPNAAPGVALPGDANGELLVHVCVDKQGSTCIPDRCCCKYPSAPTERCILGTSVDRCDSVAAAQCLSVAPLPFQCNDPNIISFSNLVTGNADQLYVRHSRTLPAGAPAAPALGFTIAALQGNGVNVPLFDNSVFDQELTTNHFVYTNFLGGSSRFTVNNPIGTFILYVINLKGSTELAGPRNEYLITVTPASANIALGYRGSADGTGTAPSLVRVPGSNSQWRFTFSNTAPINGIISFLTAAGSSDFVTSVNIQFPARRATSNVVEVVPLSGFVPSFRAPTNSPNAFPAAIVLPAAIAAPVTNPVLPVAPICLGAANTANAVIAANPVAFPIVPAAPVVNFQGFGAGGAATTVRITFPAQPAADQGLVFLVDLQVTAGDTIAFATNVNAPAAVIFSGISPIATFTNNAAMPTATPNILNVATTGRLNGIVRLAGSPTFVDITVTTATVGGLRRRATDSPSVAVGTCPTGDASCTTITGNNIAATARR